MKTRQSTESFIRELTEDSLTDSIPTCPHQLPKSIGEQIRAIGRVWATGEACPHIASPIIVAWDGLLEEWVDDVSLPLLVRKGSSIRGSVEVHESGRQIIPTDNSPAQWSCRLALRAIVPSLSQIRDMFRNDTIPVSFAHKKCQWALKTIHLWALENQPS